MRTASSLFRNRDFTVFWGGQSLSAVGTALSMVALPLLVLQATGSVVQMGLLTAITAVGTIVTGLFAGVVVDHVDRRRLMIAADLGRAVLHGIVPLVWFFGPHVWVLYVVAALTAALSNLFQVAYVTAIPNLVAPDQFTAANGRLRASDGIAAVIGPALAGLLAVPLGPAGVVGLDGLTFLASAAGLWFVRLRMVARPAVVGEDEGSGLRDRFLAGVRFLWRQSALRWLTILLTLFIFVTTGLDDILIYYVQHDLRQPSQVVGSVLGFASLGAILAALLAATLRRLFGFGLAWIGAILTVGVAITGVGLAGDPVLVATLAAAVMFGTTLAGVMSMSVRQELTPDHLLGRVTAAFWTIHYSAAPLGAALLTMTASRFGVAVAGIIAGGCCLAIAVAGLFTPLRSTRPAATRPAGAINPPTAAPSAAGETS